MSEKREAMRKAIQDAKDIKRETVEVSEWALAIEVRALSTLQRSTLFEKARAGIEGDKVDLRILYPQLVIESSYVPESGIDERVFEEGDVDWINSKASSATSKVAEKALELSGMSKAVVDQIKKDFAAAPNTVSSSSSPNASE